MVLPRPPYRSDFERQCFPALPRSSCIDASTIETADIATLRTYLFSSGHVVNNRRASDRDNIAFFDGAAIRAAARRYFTPRELITRILDSRVLQGGRLKPLHDDADLRDAIDALDASQLRDRERFLLLYAADTFPRCVLDELDPLQISAGFTALQDAVRTRVDALRGGARMPPVRNFVLTRLRQRAGAETVQGDNVLREFVVTLDAARITREEMRAVVECVSGRPIASGECVREFTRMQDAMRAETRRAVDVLRRRCEPRMADDSVLRVALAMLDVRCETGSGDDVRCQVVRALSVLYDACDELLAPGASVEMTLLCVQVNLFAACGGEAMALGGQEQRDLFARMRADLGRVDRERRNTEPAWLDETMLRRMTELWDTGMDAEVIETGDTDAQTGKDVVGGGAECPINIDIGDRAGSPTDTLIGGGEAAEMAALEVEVEYLSPPNCSVSPQLATISPKLHWADPIVQDSEPEEKETLEEVLQPEWQNIEASEDEDEDDDGSSTSTLPSRSPVPRSSPHNPLQAHRGHRAPGQLKPLTPVTLEHPKTKPESPRVQRLSPRSVQHKRREVSSDEDPILFCDTPEQGQSGELSKSDSSQSDSESEQQDVRPPPKEPERIRSVAAKAKPRQPRLDDSGCRIQTKSDPDTDAAGERGDLLVETNVVQGDKPHGRGREREIECEVESDQVPWPRPKKQHRKPTVERGAGRRTDRQGKDHVRRANHRR